MNLENEYYAKLMRKLAKKVHPLAEGENVGSIARQYKVTEQQIYDANPSSKLKERATKLQIGEPINIPESALDVSSTLAGKPLNEQIKMSADWAGVPSPVLAAMVDVESRGQAGATSQKGAQGLGQLMPVIQKAFGVTDPYDPAQNLPATAMWLSGLLKNAPGTTDQEKTWHALMQYNWSPAKFSNWYTQGRDPRVVPVETKRHAKKVFDRLGWSVPNAYMVWYLSDVGISKPLR